MTDHTREEAQRRADARLRHPKPKRKTREPESRPSAAELAGVSEYEAQAASGSGDPTRRLVRPRKQGAAPLSARPDELGRRFLERAAQTTKNTRAASPPEENPELSPGERNMLDAVEGEVETEDQLVTRLTLPTDKKHR